MKKMSMINLTGLSNLILGMILATSFAYTIRMRGKKIILNIRSPSDYGFYRQRTSPEDCYKHLLHNRRPYNFMTWSNIMKMRNILKF